MSKHLQTQASGQRKLPAQGWNLLVPDDWKVFFKCWVCNSDHSPSLFLGNYNASPALFQIQNARCVRVYILPSRIFKYMKILVWPTVIYRVVFFHCFNLQYTKLFLSNSRLQYRDWLIIIEKPTNKACCWIVPLQVFSLLSSHQPPS